MEIKPVTKANVTEQVYEQMLGLILSGTFKADAKLPSETQLGDMFQVSRHTIRSVLNRFYTMGMIETVPGDGTYLKRMSNKAYTSGLLPMIVFEEHDVFTVMEYRMALETESARLCAAKADDEDLQLIRSELELLDSIQDDRERFAKKDIDFHVAIAKACKNSLIYESMKIVREIQNSRMSAYIMRTIVQQSEHEHRKIFTAIEKHDAEGASNAMYAHLAAVIERFHAVQGDKPE